MKICTKCVLPETFPGIYFDAYGQCSYCNRFRGIENQEQLKERYKQKFLGIMGEIKGKGPYDALMAYSGGKDSTYTLRLMTEDYGLKVLAITFDHGFVSPAATRNIRQVAAFLDVDHMTISPGAKTLREVFVKSMSHGIYPIKALERASSICNSCMNLVKSFLLKTALEMQIPMVAYGWSPGQAPVQSAVFKTNASIIREMQKAMLKPVKEIVGDRLSGFMLGDRSSNAVLETSAFPYLIHPLAFTDYDEEHILESVRKMGWVDPKDTDANSTNCLLNSFANEVHLKQLGFHPYAFEIAGLVREGYMTREEGLKKLSAPSDPKMVEYVRNKLGLSGADLNVKGQSPNVK